MLRKLETPSLEVARTTLRLVLLILSFQFRPAFPHVAGIGFPTSTPSLLADKGTFFSFYLKLGPVTLTYKCDLDRNMINHYAKYPGQTVMVQTHTDKHTTDRLQQPDHGVVSNHYQFVEPIQQAKWVK